MDPILIFKSKFLIFFFFFDFDYSLFFLIFICCCGLIVDLFHVVIVNGCVV